MSVSTKLSGSVKVISVEGIIGAGKTTLLQKLKNKSKFNNLLHVLAEPVECWIDVRKNLNGKNTNKYNSLNGNFNILECMYEDGKRWGLTMQSWALHTRAVTILNYIKTLKNTGETNILMIERSLHANKIFSEIMKEMNYLNDLEWVIYNKLYNYYQGEVPQINGMIYLNTDVEEAMNRLKLRNRKGEISITKEYQKKLKLKHDKIVNESMKNKIITINNNPNVMDLNQCNKVIVEIDNWLHKLCCTKF